MIKDIPVKRVTNENYCDATLI